MDKGKFTHKELVEIGYQWLLKNGSCGIAFKELSTIATEIPDVIGFASGGYSALIEVKVSRSDFLADKKKVFRQHPELGMGTQRFYLCPKGVINVKDLPKGWGLIWVDEKGKAKCIHKNYLGTTDKMRGFKKNVKAEQTLMYSALRRLFLRGRFEEIYQI